MDGGELIVANVLNGPPGRAICEARIFRHVFLRPSVEPAARSNRRTAPTLHANQAESCALLLDSTWQNAGQGFHIPSRHVCADLNTVQFGYVQPRIRADFHISASRF